MEKLCSDKERSELYVYTFRNNYAQMKQVQIIPSFLYWKTWYYLFYGKLQAIGVLISVDTI